MIKKYLHSLRRKLAKIWLDVNFQLTVIGVTGSYGKTTTVCAIAAVLSAKYSVSKTDLNLDTVYNLPVTILKTKIWNEILVLEYGVDHIGEMDFHLSLVKPKIAVLTGITSVHTDEEHFGSLENIIKEKRKLIDSLPSDGLAIFNYDDEIVRKIGEEYSGRKIFYGSKKEADVWASDIKITTEGTFFMINQENRENKKVEVETRLLGYPAVYCCLTAWVAGKELGVSTDKILEVLKKLKPLKGRFSIESGPMGTTLINDALRANFASTVSGLRSFAKFPGRKICILGEMGEIGEKEEDFHRLVGNEVARLELDAVVGVGPLTKHIIDEAKKGQGGKVKVFWAEDVNEAVIILKKLLNKGDLLYVKASLLKHLERIILQLKGISVSCKEVSCQRYQQCNSCSLLNKLVK